MPKKTSPSSKPKKPKLPSQVALITLNATPREQISNHVWLCYIQEENLLERRWPFSTAIIVDPWTRAEEMRSVWSEIDSANQQIKELLGTDPRGIQTSIMADLMRLQANKDAGYGTWAQDINFDLLAYLLWSQDQGREAASRTLALQVIDAVFDAFGWDHKAMEEFLEAARRTLSGGEAPWALAGSREVPVTSSKVRWALGRFDRRLKNRTIVLGNADYTKQIRQIRETALFTGYWPRAAALFAKDNPERWAKYAERYRKRVQGLLPQAMEESG